MIHTEAQLLDPLDTDYCATLTMRAPDDITARRWAAMAATAMGMHVAQVYEIEPPKLENANVAVRS